LARFDEQHAGTFGGAPLLDIQVAMTGRFSIHIGERGQGWQSGGATGLSGKQRGGEQA
jgi:hypothetical protein